jgi:hypothetical protein
MTVPDDILLKMAPQIISIGRLFFCGSCQGFKEKLLSIASLEKVIEVLWHNIK